MNSFGDLLCRFAVGVNDQRGRLAIQGFPNRQHLGHFLINRLAREAGTSRPAESVGFQSSDKSFYGGVQPDDRAGVFHSLPIFSGQDRSPTTGNHLMRLLKQVSKSFRFPFSESGFPFVFEDSGDGAAGTLFNHTIAVHPRPAKSFGKPGSDTGFSTGAITDQSDDHARNRLRFERLLPEKSLEKGPLNV